MPAPRSQPTPLRVVIDARHLHGVMQGMDRFVLEVLNRLGSDNRLAITVLHTDGFPRSYLDHPERFSFVYSRIGGSRPLQHLLIPLALLRLRPDVYYYPFIDPPLLSPARRNVFTVHDLNKLFFSKHAATERWYAILAAKILIPAACLRYDAVVVVSEFVRAHLGRAVPWSRNKLHVLSHGFDPSHFAPAQPESAAPGLPTRFILYIGNNRPHKNITGLLSAFARMGEREPDLRLIIAGNMSPRFPDPAAEAQRLGVGSRTILMRSPNDRLLAELYRHALVFVHPSFSEGFGIPLLEAMHFGAAIACANCTSLPEVAGDAAVFFNPESPEDMAGKILALLNDNRMREDVIQRGRRRVREFTWERTAASLLTVLLSAGVRGAPDDNLCRGGTARHD